jgi:hypothetical protein
MFSLFNGLSPDNNYRLAIRLVQGIESLFFGLSMGRSLLLQINRTNRDDYEKMHERCPIKAIENYSMRYLMLQVYPNLKTYRLSTLKSTAIPKSILLQLPGSSPFI